MAEDCHNSHACLNSEMEMKQANMSGITFLLLSFLIHKHYTNYHIIFCIVSVFPFHWNALKLNAQLIARNYVCFRLSAIVGRKTNNPGFNRSLTVTEQKALIVMNTGWDRNCCLLICPLCHFWVFTGGQFYSTSLSWFQGVVSTQIWPSPSSFQSPLTGSNYPGVIYL